jgi:hypothetical protein
MAQEPAHRVEAARVVRTEGVGVAGEDRLDGARVAWAGVVLVKVVAQVGGNDGNRVGPGQQFREQDGDSVGGVRPTSTGSSPTSGPRERSRNGSSARPQARRSAELRVQGRPVSGLGPGAQSAAQGAVRAAGGGDSLVAAAVDEQRRSGDRTRPGRGCGGGDIPTGATGRTRDAGRDPISAANSTHNGSMSDAGSRGTDPPGDLETSAIP